MQAAAVVCCRAERARESSCAGSDVGVSTTISTGLVSEIRGERRRGAGLGELVLVVLNEASERKRALACAGAGRGRECCEGATFSFLEVASGDGRCDMGAAEARSSV